MTLMYFERPPAVFIRVRKTGSTSVVRGLFRGARQAAEKSDGIFRPEWSSLFVFAFVRNPFERMISCFEMFKSINVEGAVEERQRSDLTLSTLMDVIENESIGFSHKGNYLTKLKQHALPMTHPSYHLKKAKFIGRYEHFERDFRKVAEILGAKVTQVPHFRNNRATKDYRSFFDADSRKRAERILAKDMDTFGYTF